jgi:hypothetical protein
MCDVARQRGPVSGALAVCHWIQEAVHGAVERCLTPSRTPGVRDSMNEFRRTGRAAQWVIRELGLPALVKACVSCRSARHHPTGKFRVNANGKLLDVWMLIRCERCGRTGARRTRAGVPGAAHGHRQVRAPGADPGREAAHDRVRPEPGRRARPGLLRAYPAARGHRRQGTRRLHLHRHHGRAAVTRSGRPRAPGGTPDSRGPAGQDDSGSSATSSAS